MTGNIALKRKKEKGRKRKKEILLYVRTYYTYVLVSTVYQDFVLILRSFNREHIRSSIIQYVHSVLKKDHSVRTFSTYIQYGSLFLFLDWDC